MLISIQGGHGYNNTLLTDFVEVERVFSGYGTVEPGLEVRGPVVTKYALATRVLLAHSGHAGKYALAAVDVLDGCLAKEEEYVLADVVGAHKVWFCEIEKKFVKHLFAAVVD